MKKSNKKIIITIICTVAAVLVIEALGYLIYDKFIKKDEIKLCNVVVENKVDNDECNISTEKEDTADLVSNDVFNNSDDWEKCVTNNYCKIIVDSDYTIELKNFKTLTTDEDLEYEEFDFCINSNCFRTASASYCWTVKDGYLHVDENFPAANTLDALFNKNGKMIYDFAANNYMYANDSTSLELVKTTENGYGAQAYIQQYCNPYNAYKSTQTSYEYDIAVIENDELKIAGNVKKTFYDSIMEEVSTKDRVYYIEDTTTLSKFKKCLANDDKECACSIMEKVSGEDYDID